MENPRLKAESLGSPFIFLLAISDLASADSRGYIREPGHLFIFLLGEDLSSHSTDN